MNEVVICDLDSTLCDTSHRDHLAQKKEWEEFYQGCDKDLINEWCLKILFGIIYAYPDLKFFFITGRPERTRDKTYEWLRENLPSQIYSNSYLFHRPDKGWSGKTTEFKKSIYDFHIKPYHRVLFVLEDDKKLIQMWRAEGLVCLDCAGNDF